VDRLSRAIHGTQPSHVHWLLTPLDVDLPGLARDRGVANEAPGGLAEERLTRFRGLLQARRDIHRITRCTAAACAGVTDHDLARVDADAHLDLEVPLGPERGVQRPKRLLHVRRRSNRPESVVLVQHRDAEDGNNGVADELFDRPAVVLEDLAHRLEPATHDRAERLGIEALTQARRARDVREHHGDDLARLPTRRRRLQGRGAGHAEACADGVWRTAGGACDHAPSLGVNDGATTSDSELSGPTGEPYW